jgi:hypothetical protein
VGEAYFGEKWPDSPPTCQAVVKGIDRLCARVMKLKKQPTSASKEVEISKFLQEEFLLPHLGYRMGKVVKFSPVKSSAKSRGVTDKRICEDMRQKLYATKRNANKRLKRKIQEQERLIQDQQEQICKYERKLSGTELKLKKLRMKLDRVSHRSVYWETKAYESRSDESGTILRAEMASLKDEIASLHLTNAELNEAFESVMSESEMIQTMKHGKYTDEIRTCVYELLSLMLESAMLLQLFGVY